MCRLQTESPACSAIRDASALLIIILCLLLLLGICVIQYHVEFDGLWKMIFVNGVIITFVIHCYKMLCFQYQIGTWLEKRHLQTSTRTTALFVLLCIVSYLGMCELNDGVISGCLQLCLGFGVLFGIANYFAGFSRIQKLIAAQLSNSTTSDHQQ